MMGRRHPMGVLLVLGMSHTRLLAGSPLVDLASFQRPPETVILECVNRALKLRPRSNKVQARAAWLFAVLGQGGASRRCREKALPGDAWAHLWVGRALWQEGFREEGIQTLARVNFEGAAPEIAIGACAETLARGGRWAEADALMVALAKVEPEACLPFVHFGRACLAGGRPEAARVWFDRAREVRPADPELWALMGEAFAQAACEGRAGSQGNGLWDGAPAAVAGRCAETVRFLAPKSSYFISRAGALWLAAGDTANARTAYKDAEGLDGQGARALAARAHGWLMAGRKVEGSAAYQALFKLPLEGLSTRRGRFLAEAAADLLLAGDVTWAQAAMTASYQVDDRDSQACLIYGRAALQAKRPDLAAEAFARAAAGAPKDEEVWLDIGCALADGLVPPSQVR